jgi:predicted nucleic acid-binding protein
MIILDTNVLSELMKLQPNSSVVLWIGKYQATSLFITTLTQAEILYGLEILPAGKRRTALKKVAKSMFELDFTGRILPFDADAAQLFATIAAKRRKIGRPISQIDAQIAAIASFYNATLATRNVDDFTECGIDIVNPWS